MQLVHGGDWAGYRAEFGRDALDFSANVSPLGLPEGVARAITAALPTADRYPDPLCRELRAKLALHEGVPAEQILCGNGAADLIFRLVWAKKPRRALVTAPTFAEYATALESVGCTVERFFLREQEDFAVTDAFCAAIRPGVDMVFLCQPNNPTGQLTALPLVEQILHRCAACGTLLVVDECFLDFLPDHALHTAKGLLGEGNLVILKAFTKLYGTVFLGAPRTHEVAEASEVDNFRIAAMALPLAGILFIGLFPQTAVSAVTRAAGFFIHHPADAADYLLSPTLAAVSRTAWLLILVVGLLAWLRSRALRTRKVTDGATWGCGFTSPNVRMQYSGESYSEGLQSIATSLTQNSGEGSAVGKGEIFPAAHNFDIRHKDRFDKLFAAWWVELLRVINKRAMRLRTGKINHYVLFALAFLVLIFLLSIFNLI